MERKLGKWPLAQPIGRRPQTYLTKVATLARRRQVPSYARVVVVSRNRKAGLCHSHLFVSYILFQLIMFSKVRITILLLAFEAKESFFYKSSLFHTLVSNPQIFFLFLAPGASILAWVFGASRDVLQPNWSVTLPRCGFPKTVISQSTIYCSK